MPNAYYYSSTAGSYTLTGAISNSATTLSISSVTGLPSNTPYKLVLDPGQGAEEIVKVTGVAGTSLTVVRGWDGTAAAAHASGAQIRHMMTGEDLTLSRTHEAATTGAHGVTGSVVGTTDTQTLTNKNLSSGTNTFPTSLATLTGTQTLTNKTLDTPTTIGQATSQRLFITNGIGTTFVPLIVKGMASQSASLQQWRDSTDAVLANVDAAGAFNVKGLNSAAADITIGDVASSTQRKLAISKKSSTTATVGEVSLYVADNAGENRAALVLKNGGTENARVELASTGEARCTTGAFIGLNDSAWQSFTPTVYTNMNGTPSPISATVNYARYRRSGNTIQAHADVTLSAGTSNGIGISLPVTSRDRLLDCGTCALFGSGTPADQTGIAYMNGDKTKLVVVAYTQGFRDGTNGQFLRYSVTYEV